jgi:hypothetical protein
MSALRRVFVALLLAGLTFGLAFAAVRLRLSVPTITLTTGALFIIAAWLVAPPALRLRHPAVLVAAVLGLVVSFLPLLWVVAGFSSHAINNWRLSAFAEQFLSSPPPATSVHVVQSEVGVLTGNGNHCDFIVFISFQGPADANAVIRHYESLPVHHAIPGSTTEIQLALEGPQASRLTATDAPNEPAFDIRCH